MPKDTLIKATSLSASRLPVQVVMLVSLKSAEKTVDSCRWGRDARAGGGAAASMQRYDMADEPDGSENVASGHPDLTSRFMEAIATWKNYIVSSTE